MHQPARILIVRPSALGDVCRTVPVLASLRRAWPEARIDWVVRDTFVPAVAAHPALNRAIAFPRARFARWWRSASSTMAMLRWAKQLHQTHYDLVLDCQGLSRSALISLATGAPRRIGLRRAREFGWLAYTQRISSQAHQHTVNIMLALIEAIGIEPVRDMQLYVDDEAQQWWRSTREQRGIDQPYVVLAPTARWITKRWPIERWSAMIEPLRQRGFASCVVIGAPDEKPQVRSLVDANIDGVASVIGEADVARTMAVLADADLVIAHDSAPLHMAVGFDTPCVGLFGPTDPATVGPYGGRSRVVCASHNHLPSSQQQQQRAREQTTYRDRRLGDRLMRSITVEQVLTAVDELRDEAAERRAVQHPSSVCQPRSDGAATSTSPSR